MWRTPNSGTELVSILAGTNAIKPLCSNDSSVLLKSSDAVICNSCFAPADGGGVQLESVHDSIFSNTVICLYRELLVIGGVAAKEQLAALEQGVRDMYGLQINFLIRWSV